jgi:hypothetical protein
MSPNLGTPYVYPRNYPDKPTYFEADIDTRARRIYEYLDSLWGDDGPYLIENLLNLAQQSPQTALKALLALPPLRLILPPNVDCVVIDLKTGRMATPPGADADTEGKQFYMLMLPAKPSGGPNDENYDSFKASQQWTEAFYHAVRETGWSGGAGDAPPAAAPHLL